MSFKPSDVEARATLAIAAMTSGDYDAAETHVQAALLMLSVMSDGMIGTVQIRYDRNALNNMLLQIKQKRIEQRGTQKTRICYEPFDREDW